MNKKTTAVLCLAGISLLSGCSSMGAFENRTFWNPCPPEKHASEPEDHSKKEIDSLDETAPVKPEVIPLSDQSIESFPGWYGVESPYASTWSEFKLNTEDSFANNLSSRSIDSSWLGDLSSSDYIDISTITEGQTVNVETASNGDLLSLNTEASEQTYYVSMTDYGPVMTRGAVSPVLESSFVLSPDTPVNDLTGVQREALSQFLSSVLPEISHEAEVLLSKGVTTVSFEYTYLNRERVTNVEVINVKSVYDDYELIYRPD